MATTLAFPDKEAEDPLLYLSRSKILEYGKGQIIYSTKQRPTQLYLIVDGVVKVSRITSHGNQVTVDVYHKDEIFGESAFVTGQAADEQAVTLERTSLMTWPISEIRNTIARTPSLGIALLQILVGRSLDFGTRLESFSMDNIARRLARCLIRFSDRLGKATEDGSVRMMPFTHEMLSQTVGTSREIVTHYMNQFRRQGYLRYSRKGISVYKDALREWLRQPAS